MRFKKEDRVRLMDIIERDVALLKAHNLMDYSLLFAVERNANYSSIKGPSRATTSTISEEDEVLNKRCKYL